MRLFRQTMPFFLSSSKLGTARTNYALCCEFIFMFVNVSGNVIYIIAKYMYKCITFIFIYFNKHVVAPKMRQLFEFLADVSHLRLLLSASVPLLQTLFWRVEISGLIMCMCLNRTHFCQYHMLWHVVCSYFYIFLFVMRSSTRLEYIFSRDLSSLAMESVKIRKNTRNYERISIQRSVTLERRRAHV